MRIVTLSNRLIRIAYPLLAISVMSPDGASGQALDSNVLRITLTIPEGNWFYYRNPQQMINDGGFLGLISNFEYVPPGKQSLSGSVGVVTDFPLPFPAVVDYCDYETTVALHVSLQVRRRFSSNSIGAGVHGLYYRYSAGFSGAWYCDPSESKQQEIFLNGYTLGPSLSIDHRFRGGLRIGLTYLPSVLLWERAAARLGYSHTLYLGFTIGVATIRL